MAPVLLCHGSGGWAVRAWLHNHAADHRVHRVLTLATAHSACYDKNWWGGPMFSTKLRQKLLAGGWWQDLGPAEPAELAARAALFVCRYSNCDESAFPASAATLAGADNRFVPGLGHFQMASDRAVMQAGLAEIARD